MSSSLSDLAVLNLPKVQMLKIRRCGKNLQVWDSLRGVWLVLTPEEWVRQHFIGYLISVFGVSATSITQEYRLKTPQGTLGRADIVVFSASKEPRLVVECKAASVNLDDAVLEQVCRYNTVLSVQYIAITNGLKHYYFQINHDNGTYMPVEILPLDFLMSHK